MNAMSGHFCQVHNCYYSAASTCPGCLSAGAPASHTQTAAASPAIPSPTPEFDALGRKPTEGHRRIGALIFACSRLFRLPDHEELPESVGDLYNKANDAMFEYIDALEANPLVLISSSDKGQTYTVVPAISAQEPAPASPAIPSPTESKTPRCNARVKANIKRGYRECDLEAGHDGRHCEGVWTWGTPTCAATSGSYKCTLAEGHDGRHLTSLGARWVAPASLAPTESEPARKLQCVWCGATSNADPRCSSPDGDGHLFKPAAASLAPTGGTDWDALIEAIRGRLHVWPGQAQADMTALLSEITRLRETLLSTERERDTWEAVFHGAVERAQNAEAEVTRLTAEQKTLREVAKRIVTYARPSRASFDGSMLISDHSVDCLRDALAALTPTGKEETE